MHWRGTTSTPWMKKVSCWLLSLRDLSFSVLCTASHIRRTVMRNTSSTAVLCREENLILPANGYRVNGAHHWGHNLDCLTPTGQSDLQSFVELVNQLSASTSSVAPLLAPLHPLLSTKNKFLWMPDIHNASVTAQQLLASAPNLSYFDPWSWPDCALTLVNRAWGSCSSRSQVTVGSCIVQAGSHFPSDPESRYVIIELEFSVACFRGKTMFDMGCQGHCSINIKMHHS